MAGSWKKRNRRLLQKEISPAAARREIDRRWRRCIAGSRRSGGRLPPEKRMSPLEMFSNEERLKFRAMKRDVWQFGFDR
ncbi:hypothetical protein Dsin_000122 [Dipteronia sinensis]|uniref:Uncharacterized protein n=1 Tax=Dipteronia sinensis TaxID=43782 RepID=A0AAD9ZHS4_9ROSI|nr:hypothetical protein Dsin_000122 [Dipteronia sinensis]